VVALGVMITLEVVVIDAGGVAEVVAVGTVTVEVTAVVVLAEVVVGSTTWSRQWWLPWWSS
jgi:hypothetical protein